MKSVTMETDSQVTDVPRSVMSSRVLHQTGRMEESPTPGSLLVETAPLTQAKAATMETGNQATDALLSARWKKYATTVWMMIRTV